MNHEGNKGGNLAAKVALLAALGASLLPNAGCTLGPDVKFAPPLFPDGACQGNSVNHIKGLVKKIGQVTSNKDTQVYGDDGQPHPYPSAGPVTFDVDQLMPDGSKKPCDFATPVAVVDGSHVDVKLTQFVVNAPETNNVDQPITGSLDINVVKP